MNVIQQKLALLRLSGCSVDWLRFWAMSSDGKVHLHLELIDDMDIASLAQMLHSYGLLETGTTP